MKILIASSPATGHLNPLLAMGRFLTDEGHEVAFLSGSALRDPIERVGAGAHAPEEARAGHGGTIVVTHRRRVAGR